MKKSYYSLTRKSMGHIYSIMATQNSHGKKHWEKVLPKNHHQKNREERRWRYRRFETERLG